MTSKRLTNVELESIVKNSQVETGMQLNNLRAQMADVIKVVSNMAGMMSSQPNTDTVEKQETPKTETPKPVRESSGTKSAQTESKRRATKQRKTKQVNYELRITELDNGDIAIVLPADTLDNYLSNDKVFENENGVFYTSKFLMPKGVLNDAVEEGDGNLYFNLKFHTKKTK